jgi:hypothetical protein
MEYEEIVRLAERYKVKVEDNIVPLLKERQQDILNFLLVHRHLHFVLGGPP